MSVNTRYKVKAYNHKTQFILVVVIVLFVIGLMVASYVAGRKMVGFDPADINALQHRVLDLNQRLHTVEKEKRKLSTQSVKYKRAAEFNRASEISAKQALTAAQEELSEAKQELFFYKNLFKPETSNHVVNIHSFVIAKPSDKGIRAYSLVLTKFKGGDALKKGRVTLTFKFKNGHVKTLNSRFKFKFFQRLKGLVPTHDDQKLDQVVLKLFDNSDRVILEKKYPWSKLIKGAS